MAWLLAAKVVEVVVEMVVKFNGNGLFGEKKRKEEEEGGEDGVVVVVVVGIEEEMEEKVVEKMVVEKREGWPAKEGGTAVVLGSVGWL